VVAAPTGGGGCACRRRRRRNSQCRQPPSLRQPLPLLLPLALPPSPRSPLPPPAAAAHRPLPIRDVRRAFVATDATCSAATGNPWACGPDCGYLPSAVDRAGLLGRDDGHCWGGAGGHLRSTAAGRPPVLAQRGGIGRRGRGEMEPSPPPAGQRLVVGRRHTPCHANGGAAVRIAVAPRLPRPRPPRYCRRSTVYRLSHDC